MPVPTTPNEALLAADQWSRYLYGRDRGHRIFLNNAKKCEDMYLGAGLQWSKDDKETCEEVQGRKCVEVNTIFVTVNRVVGEQIHTRADVSFAPKKGMASQDVANDLTKLTRQIFDDNSYQWLETEIWTDGLIQQRGYIDIRMDFDDNLQGDVRYSLEDPMEVIPDPDANTYHPKGWHDVIVTRWLSLDEILGRYGAEAAKKVESYPMPERDFGEEDDEPSRSRFGTEQVGSWVEDSARDDRGIKRYRVIDRQWRKQSRRKFFLNEYGDLRPVPDNMSKEQIADKVASGEWVITEKTTSRVRWTVSTVNAVIFDEWSPYNHFTIVPFFPYFRRGRTRGIVDNAISPQETFNKALSSILHTSNSTANSGWLVEEDSLTNMQTDDLADVGMKTGLVIEYKRSSNKPEKIKPNELPPATAAIASMSEGYIKKVTGISDTEDEASSPEESGVAYEGKNFQSKIHLAGPLDNLAKTRHMIVEITRDLIQQYYTEERVIMITEEGDMGERQHVPLVINKRDSAGRIINDLSLGEYAATITSVPHSASFQNTQFRQLMEMKKYNVSVPDTAIVEVSSIAKKRELIEMMSKSDPEMDALTKERFRKEIEEIAAGIILKQAQAEKAKTDAVVGNVTAGYSAVQAAQVLAQVPGLVPVADEILLSSGFKDQNSAPIFVQPSTPELGQLPQSTSPQFPAHPATPVLGMDRGIETQRADGAIGGIQ